MRSLTPSLVLIALTLTACPEGSGDGTKDAEDTDSASEDTSEDTGDSGSDDTGAGDTDDTDDTGSSGPTGPVVDVNSSGLGTVTGPSSLCGFGDDLPATCGDGAEWVTRFTAPWDGVFTFAPSSVDFNQTLSTHDDDAAAAERECLRSAWGLMDTDVTLAGNDGIVETLDEGDSVLVGLAQDDCLGNDLVIRGRPACVPAAVESQGAYLGFDAPLADLGNGVLTPTGSPVVNASVKTTASSTVPGVVGSALGSDTCVEVNHDNTLWPGQLGTRSSQTYTWSAWIKTDNSPASGEVGVIMELRDCVYDCGGSTGSNTAMLRLAMRDDGRVQAFSRSDDFGFQDSLYSDGSLADGEWHHVVLTRYDGTAVRDWYLYVDGVEADSVARDDGGNYPLEPTSEPLTIGCGFEQNTGTPDAVNLFPGAIDSVTVLPVVTEAADVTAWYTCGNPSPTP